MKVNNGFSLVESMVALVILTVIFAAVWEWFGVAANSTRKIERAVAYPEVFDMFVNRMHNISLESNRSGSFTFNDFEVQWQATPERVSSNEILNRQRQWEVALFKVDAEIFHQGVSVGQFTTKQTDYWRQADDIRSIFGN